MHDLEKLYTSTVFRIVRILFLVGSIIGIAFSLATIIDLSFHMHWKMTWQTIPGGLLFAFACYAGSVFVKKIGEFYTRLRE